MKPKFFSTPAEFRQWLERNHDTATELLIGFHKKSSGKKSITYPEALDEALCFGWIDGVRKKLNETSYMQRFTPRKPNSIWSNINVNHVERLKKDGRMHASGLAAYERRDPKRTGIYSFENESVKLAPAYEKKFRQNKKAWKFFEEQPPYYKKLMIFRIMAGKKEETRIRKLDQLIECSANGHRIGLLTGKEEPQKGTKKATK
ncbi:MAG TPA: YdeI/OmpD-associated family protein [Pyrinomonadaceae bacterium]|nr:YdeI/OmpD-associated family protein [Pyrinomonadaceae bacterium]